MRLIDADGLFSAIGDKEDDISKAKDRAVGSLETYYEGVADGLLLAKGMIDVAPEIDTVHAAGGCYCWECKYRTKDTQWTRADFCGRRDADPMMIARPDDYCSRGERREENDTI